MSKDKTCQNGNCYRCHNGVGKCYLPESIGYGETREQPAMLSECCRADVKNVSCKMCGKDCSVIIFGEQKIYPWDEQPLEIKSETFKDLSYSHKVNVAPKCDLYGEECLTCHPDRIPKQPSSSAIEEIDEMVRDFTAVGSRPKSEVRRRIEAYGNAREMKEHERMAIKAVVENDKAYERGKEEGWQLGLKDQLENYPGDDAIHKAGFEAFREKAVREIEKIKIKENPPSYLGGTDNEWLDGYYTGKKEILDSLRSLKEND